MSTVSLLPTLAYKPKPELLLSKFKWEGLSSNKVVPAGKIVLPKIKKVLAVASR